MTDTHDDGAEQQQADEELHQRLIDAVRSALTHGTPMDDVRWLATGCGISYDDVVGAVPMTKMCERCRGSGEIAHAGLDRWPCDKCNGNGFIKTGEPR